MPPEHDAGASRNLDGGAATPGGPATPSSRRQAIVLAGHAGDPAVARAALGDQDPSLRVAALAALARRGHLSVADLRRGLADSQPEVRRRAAELAARVPADGITVDLMGLLDDGEALVAEMAAWSLGERQGSSEVVEALCSVARTHDDPLCRESAVAALGALGDPIGLPTILDATHDRPAIRRRAVIALAPFEGPDVDAALERARTDRDWQVRQAAEDQEGRTPC